MAKDSIQQLPGVKYNNLVADAARKMVQIWGAREREWAEKQDRWLWRKLFGEGRNELEDKEK